MPIFVKLSEAERKKFFNKVKLEIGKSWEGFYPKYNISRAMFFNYLSGRYDIPKDLFLDWKRIVGVTPISFTEENKQKYMKKEIPKIIMDERLSEILGVLNGDGHLSRFKYEVCVVGDLREEDYFMHLKKLFEEKFGLSFTLRREKSCLKLRCYSKEISNLLFNKYQLPKGNKLGKLKIPKQAFKSKKFLKAYIRGLYDTDGSFYFRRKKEPVIQITSADTSFLREVEQALGSLGFSVSKGNQRIFLYRREEIKRFFKEIKPSNSKHLKKHKNT